MFDEDSRMTYATGLFAIGTAPAGDDFTDQFPWEPFAAGPMMQFGVNPQPTPTVLWRRRISIGALKKLSESKKDGPRILGA